MTMASPVMEDNVTIIGVVKQYPILYDLAHPYYKDRRKKNAAWDDVGRQLNMTGENLKKKWKNLRDCYFKHLKCFTDTPGSRLQTYERYKKWQWAHEMEFIKKYMRLGPEVENIEEIKNYMITKDNKSSEAIAAPSLEQSKSSGVMKRPRTFIDDDLSCSTPKSNKLSSLEYLMLSYAKTLESFSEKRQSITKMKIAQIIMDAELEELEEQELEENFGNQSCYSSSDADGNQIESYDMVIKEET